MLDGIRAIAWDFDGVLNRNILQGRFVWADRLEDDLGIPVAEFQAGIFTPDFGAVISGKLDLASHVQAYLNASGRGIDAEELLAYWFAKDDLKDPYTCDLLDRLADKGITQVIATNNEHRRATYIERVSGFGARVSRVFSSGRIGHAKPEDAFFHHVAASLGLSAQEILLIDDSAANVRAAEALGWHGYHFTEETRSGLATWLGL